MDYNKLRELEDTVASDPEAIYVDINDELVDKSIITLEKKERDSTISIKSLSGIDSIHNNIVESFVNSKNSGKSSDEETITVVSSDYSATELVTDYIDDAYELSGNRMVRSTNQLPTITDDCASFFQCFDEENSINNVIACEDKEVITYADSEHNDVSDVSSQYIFDKDPNILPDDECDPFLKYDTYGNEQEKNKHRRQKNINRLGWVAFSTAVIMGSTWYNDYFN